MPDTEPTVNLLEGTIAKLHYEPGDTIVLMCDRLITEQARAWFAHSLQGHFPGCKCVILDGGVKIGVMSPQS